MSRPNVPRKTTRKDDKENRGKVAAGVAALAVGAGLLTGSLNCD
jgi:hypothetical protein